MPIDTDGDGISDSTDNCPWVANPLQEDSNAIIAPTVDFIKIDRADYTLTENQDCINS
ncbi:thrombospondin type 3 repeat-containing protein [Patescibacteria group bacterium]|nr:thrombospondin type 3 repeat-containing protein [Patescibacteria group bacterium]MBU1758122.1 thrombospondin type 3 repeat-containing protein [Patescibacteria group bacterium]